MTFTTPPGTAAWRHLDARDGFEVAYFQPADDGLRVEGCTTAVEEGETWIVGYAIELDASWTTRSARITGRSASGLRHILLEADGVGHWRVDGTPAPHLDGCLDVDLESSAMTNAFPVHRMGLRVGDRSPAPAAYVRATDLAVERLEQDYVRIADEGSRQRYDYSALVFDFACRLVYDESGLVLDYPEIAVRAA
ncbi:putative glycolipid-binding domain-containing protein [Streptosporangium sp. NBC_01469]|uniref:putative glycolipid-binding domain-containing protein n=1 Tax=Streptosporangium sp. NBC_01469 TaxID=2903898 RepID=UPI002E2D5F2A|nr:putative glycolipid-binding domain-containing protein [Streptosporangium sp. NBC_01469]